MEILGEHGTIVAPHELQTAPMQHTARYALQYEVASVQSTLTSTRPVQQ